MTLSDATILSLKRVQGRSAIVALVGAALCAVGFFMNEKQFLRSYLLGYLLWSGIALGALAVAMVHHVTGGAWGDFIRPALRSATRTLPLLALLFVPVVWGMPHLYRWADGDTASAGQAWYLNRTGFLVRAAVYFAVWLVFGWMVQRVRSGRDAAGRTGERVRQFSALGLVLYGLTVTFAAVDWVMSLEPDWYSTIYGMSFAVGQMLSALAFGITVILLFPTPETVGEHAASCLHDLGNLLLTFVLLWAYLAFSQYLIIWSANLPTETQWYVKRGAGAWGVVAVALIVFHFAVPLLLLLSRQVKRSAACLLAIACGIVAFRWVDLFWVTVPAFTDGAFSVHWLDGAALVTVGSVWLAAFARYHRQALTVAAHERESP